MRWKIWQKNQGNAAHDGQIEEAEGCPAPPEVPRFPESLSAGRRINPGMPGLGK